jgi:hypothetical protein
MIFPGSPLGGGTVGRFRARSPAELGDRARQRIHTWLELFAGASRGEEPSDQALERSLQNGHPARDTLEGREQRRLDTFEAFREAPNVGALARARFPEAAARVIGRADRTVCDRFDILGHQNLSYGDPIDWHADPLRGRRAPLVHWSRVPYLDVERIGDHKVIWELNRHQHLVTLGQAFCLTGDERYASTIVRHMTEWMDSNPPKLGINWSSSLELAFRAIAWAWALRLVGSSRAVSRPFKTRVLKFLYIHARHISAHLSTYFSPNTHLTGEALGLLYVGTCFEEFRDARRWRELGWSILERELARQIRSDGTYFEQTTWYQRYTADFYLHALQLREYAGHSVSDDVRQRIGHVIDVLIHFTGPCGLTPLIGDDDGGQLLPLVIAAPGDFRATLAHAAILLQRPDCAALAGDGAACLPWLMGKSGVKAFDEMERRLPVSTARLFPDGGYFVARDRWASDANCLVVDCGPHGSLSFGHAHADALAFELTVGGVPILVDSGTFSYAGPERDEFRATAAHNTLTVDGLSSSESDRPFRWKTAARCALSSAAGDQRFAYFKGEHDGFMRLRDPARHRRAIFTAFGDFTAVLDIIEANGPHAITGRFHFSPDLAVARSSDGTIITASDRRDSGAPIVDLLVVGQNVTLGLEAGRVAPTYGMVVDAQVGTFNSQGTGTRQFWTVIVPRGPGRRAVPTVRPATARSTAGIVIESAEFEDLVVADARPVALDGLTTDATWIWIRRLRATSQATEFVLIDGSQLSIDGRSVASFPTRRQFVRGSLHESGWQLHAPAT